MRVAEQEQDSLTVLGPELVDAAVALIGPAPVLDGYTAGLTTFHVDMDQSPMLKGLSERRAPVPTLGLWRQGSIHVSVRRHEECSSMPHDGRRKWLDLALEARLDPARRPASFCSDERAVGLQC
jgi:hypothetical protein